MSGTRKLFMVVIDKNSLAGSTFAEGRDWAVNGHPALACSAIETDSPYYLRVTRDKEGAIPAGIALIPHHSVVTVLEDSDVSGSHSPFGFAPT